MIIFELNFYNSILIQSFIASNTSIRGSKVDSKNSKKYLEEYT